MPVTKIHKLTFSTLFSIYMLLAIIGLIILSNNAIENLTGNRTLVAAVIFSYLLLMCIGLYYKKRIFLIISGINFIFGIGFVTLANLMLFTSKNNYITAIIIFSYIGLFISIISYITQLNDQSYNKAVKRD